MTEYKILIVYCPKTNEIYEVAGCAPHGNNAPGFYLLATETKVKYLIGFIYGNYTILGTL